MVDDREISESQDENCDSFDIRGAGESSSQTPGLSETRRRRFPATVLLAIFGLLVVAATACGGSTGDATDATGDVANISPTATTIPLPVSTESPVVSAPTVTATEVASPAVVPSVTPTPVPTQPSTVLTFVEVEFDDEGGVDGLDSVRLVAISPDGKHLYAAGRDDDAVAVFSRDSTTGALTFVEVQKDNVGAVDGLDTVISLTISPDGNHIYAPSSKDNALAIFNRNSETGALDFSELVKNGVDGVDGLAFPNSLTMSPDGNSLYAAGRDDDAVAVFSRNSESGFLLFVEVHRDGVEGVDG
jgi:6-phosphogluconolactonase (cycloisomerase 2 family)